ncbi:ABC transporter substrate-binding protein [Streptomyces sp. NPDC001443]
MRTRVAEDPDSENFGPDPVPRWWQGWRGRTALFAALAVVAAGLVRWLPPTPADTSCAKDNPDLHWTGAGDSRECVGVLTEHPYSFDPALDAIVGKITKENRRVRAAWENPGIKIPYVRIAVVLPLTGDDTTALPVKQIVKSLEGAYTAQCRANQCAALHGRLGTGLYWKVPHFQLVLANMGKLETHGKTVVGQLAAMADEDEDEHPLVAATGLGISIPETKQAAVELARHHIPAVAAVVSADDINAAQLFKISPSNRDYTKAITDYLATRPDLTTGCLVYDSKQEDNFTQTLKHDFEQAFKARFKSQGKSQGKGQENSQDLCTAAFTGKTIKRNRALTGLFPPAIDNICKVNANTVFYAGRSRDLPDFLDALTKRDQKCSRHPITVITGSTGLWGAGQGVGMKAKLTDSHTSLVEASASDPDDWATVSPRTPDGFDDFRRSFLALGFARSELDTGYAILHHDAVAAVEIATQIVATDRDLATPNAADVADALVNLHTARHAELASGTVEFDGFNNGWPHKKPVPIIIVPQPKSPKPATEKPYVTP